MPKFISGRVTNNGEVADDLYQIIRGHLVSNGWTEYDVLNDVKGTRDIVFRGQALDVTADNRPLVRITQRPVGTSDPMWRLATVGYMSWDNTTHTGVGPVGAAAPASAFGFDVQEPTNNPYYDYYIRANGVSVALGFITPAVSTGTDETSSYVTYLGFTTRSVSQKRSGIGVAASSLTAGQTVLPVTTDLTAKLSAGQPILIMDRSTATAEGSYVASVSSSAVTITTPLVNSHNAGALIGYDPLPLVIADGAYTTAAGPATTGYNVGLTLYTACDLIMGTRTAIGEVLNPITRDLVAAANSLRGYDRFVTPAMPIHSGTNGVPRGQVYHIKPVKLPIMAAGSRVAFADGVYVVIRSKTQGTLLIKAED